MPFEGGFEVRVARKGNLADIALEGAGWIIQGIEAPLSTQIAPDAPLQVHFRASPRDPREPLTLHLNFDGHPYTKVFEWTPTAIDRMAHPRRLAESPEARKWTPLINDARPDASPAQPVAPKSKRSARVSETDVLRSPLQGQARTITVHGRLAYTRPADGATIGADGVYFEVRDEDITFDEVLGTGVTDAQGYYTTTFSWDDCFLCENPDIYVYFETDNSVVQVQDATFEIDYSWETARVNDYTGTNRDMGTFMPPAADQPALAICTDVVRAWRFVLNKTGHSIPAVDVQWPAAVGTTYYNPLFQEIHVEAVDEWDEAVHVHEYGHHWHNSFGNFEVPTYLDPHGGLFGHCMWCSENSLAAWEEGWADWFSDVIVRSFQADYGLASAHFDDAESTEICGGSCTSADYVLNDPWTTEGFVAALLRDIEDDTNDTDPRSGNTWSDALSLGVDEIFDVADLDAPMSVSDFFNRFKARFPQFTRELWETGRNNRYQLDVAAPGAPTELALSWQGSCGFLTWVQTFAWVPAIDDWSGIAGYSGRIMTTAALPVATQNIGNVTQYASSTCLPDGNYFFNLRAVDRMGRWSTEYASLPYTVSGGFIGGCGSGGSPFRMEAALKLMNNPLVGGNARIRLVVPSEASVRITVLDVSGRTQKRIADEVFSPGEHTITWDGVNSSQERVSPGIYFIRLESDGMRLVQRLLVIR
jgi:hypothetical protein